MSRSFRGTVEEQLVHSQTSQFSRTRSSLLNQFWLVQFTGVIFMCLRCCGHNLVTFHVLVVCVMEQTVHVLSSIDMRVCKVVWFICFY